MTGAELERQDVRRTIKLIYQTEYGAAGCCLHIITDDRNYDDESAEVCVRQAEGSRHLMCLMVARFLRRLTREERRSFLRVRPRKT